MKARPYAVQVVSLGCPKNLVDTEVMCGDLATDGRFVFTNDGDLADVTLINTCCFIAASRKEAEGEIRDALSWKRRRRGRRVVVAGCLPQRDLAKATSRFPRVDLWLGLNDEPQIAARLAALLDGDRADDTACGPPSYLYDHTSPRLMLTAPHYAFVKIADGCDHKCLYCAIPQIRGPQRSRAMDSVVAECRQLLANGVRELNLIAQDTTYYGADRDDGAALLPLLAELDALDGDFWLRLLYTHPRYVPEGLAEFMATSRHVVPYLDIPLQHISSGVLKAMGRGIDGTATRALLTRLRERVPGIALRTTFLVGYPGETDEDFAELREFVASFRFDRLGVFAYSPEEGTAAAKLTADTVPTKIAEARRAELMELQQGISLARNQALVGTTLPVLVEQALGNGRYTGRTMADAPGIDNAILFAGPGDARGFLPVTVTEAEPYDLHGIAV